MSMNGKLVLVPLAMLVVGVVLAWPRSRDDGTVTASQRLLRRLGTSLALAALTLGLVASRHFSRPGGLLLGNDAMDRWVSGWLLLFGCGVAVALLLALWPRFADGAVPVALILVGLAGFVLARDYALRQPFFPALANDPYPVVGPIATRTEDFGSLTLLQAYGGVLLGGWLAWTSPDPVLASGRRLLGRVAVLTPRAQFPALLLLPAALLAAELFTPDGWHGVGVAAWFALVLGAGLAVLRLWPDAAARLAVTILLVMGLIGLGLALTFHHGYGSDEYGLVILPSWGSPWPVLLQALGLLAVSAWLVPQTFPAARRFLGLPLEADLTRRVQRLTESRDVVADTAAADLRRLERDLHDGAQARLVALGMNLRAAERLVSSSPDAATALIAEARETSARALTELRELVRGVHPPVLADRGLADAIRALALDCPLRVETDIDLPGRPAGPIETACYFAVAEILTNAAKHSGARQARIAVSHAAGMLRIEVTDFGVGGADPGRGTGLLGVEKRLAAFDGILAVSSPAGGPTIVVLEVPCALSSPKTSTC
jgi:signal transduction histidine kinase